MSLTLLEAAKAKLEGKRVECAHGSVWHEWSGNSWSGEYKYRIAPPPKKKVKFFGWRDFAGELRLLDESYIARQGWKRVPSEDKEVEVDE